MTVRRIVSFQSLTPSTLYKNLCFEGFQEIVAGSDLGSFLMIFSMNFLMIFSMKILILSVKILNFLYEKSW